MTGQTAGPIGIEIVCGHSGVAGGCLRLKKSIIIFSSFKKKKISRATPGSSVCYNLKVESRH